MKIRAVVTGAFEVNGYIVTADDGTVLVFDPGEAEPLRRALDGAGETPAAVLLTHGHCDHADGLGGLLERFPVPVYIHPADGAWAFSDANRLPPYYPDPPARPADVRPAEEGDLAPGGVPLSVIHTPGHSPGCVCYAFAREGWLISGDLLFRGGIGRTDLRGGDDAAMASSLRRVLALPDETRVFPGHGPATTIGRERRGNPFLAAP